MKLGRGEIGHYDCTGQQVALGAQLLPLENTPPAMAEVLSSHCRPDTETTFIRPRVAVNTNGQGSSQYCRAWMSGTKSLWPPNPCPPQGHISEAPAWENLSSLRLPRWVRKCLPREGMKRTNTGQGVP